MITTPAIRIAGLHKSYGDLAVLRGVDFDVAPGRISALLGSNGAGKTTIIKVLSTQLKADGGRAVVNGFDVITQAADVRESISLTGQFAAVDEILTGRENLVLIATLRHSTLPAGSPTTCSPVSGSPSPGDAGSRPTPGACAAVSTSR